MKQKRYDKKKPPGYWTQPHVQRRGKAGKLRRAYGLSLEQFEQMIAEQNGICVLCPAPFRVVDHDHRTGKVRGLLCNSCNVMLAPLDHPEWLVKAASYLRRGEL